MGHAKTKSNARKNAKLFLSNFREVERENNFFGKTFSTAQKKLILFLRDFGEVGMTAYKPVFYFSKTTPKIK